MASRNLEIRENVALAPLSTLRVGGPARFFVSAQDVSEVEQAVEFARNRELPLFVLGAGSNVVVSDRGFPGVIIHMAIGGMEMHTEGKSVVFEVGAGCDWDSFVQQSIAQNLGGIECLSGIPGTVGGTPVQNVGAYGQEVSETIVSVEAYDLAENRVRTLANAECGFAYRRSIFNSSARGRFIVLRVKFWLLLGAEPALRYSDLQKYFADSGQEPSLQEVRKAVLKIRAQKGMLITAGDPDSRSAGSFFKNPVLSSGEFEQLEQRAAERALRVPSYPALAQHNKVSAAWLVEHSGFCKAYAKGAAGISSKHSLAIVNRGGATAADIIALRDEIQSTVEQVWGVRLEAEPVFVGF